ncbi:hypothetical protein [Amycolatopsis sp. NPDC102389]|uniref:hypothetical protein n=1 Tax=Amycolatopsis sp. NPDC102389 TaxID=3363941 RepID=UPI003820B9A4
MFDDEKPLADVADQLRPVRPADDDLGEHLDGEPPAVADMSSTPEADPADVADQRRDVPASADREPWP